MDDLLKPADAAKIIGCSEKHIRKMIKLGRIKASIVNFSAHKPRYRMTIQAVKDFIAGAEIKAVRI